MLYITDVLPCCLIFPSMLFLSPANIPRSRQDGTGTMPVINLWGSVPVILFPTKVNLIFLPPCPRSVLYWIPYSRSSRSRLTFNFLDKALGCISTCKSSTSSVAVPVHSGCSSVTSSLIFQARDLPVLSKVLFLVLANSHTHLSRLKFNHSF